MAPDSISSEQPNSMDVSNLGGIGRVFGAVISRLGVPIPTQINQDTLDIAQEICKYVFFIRKSINIPTCYN